MSSFKGSENIQKKEDGPDRSVSDNQSSSVTLNELVMKARKSYLNSKLQQRVHTMTKLPRNISRSMMSPVRQKIMSISTFSINSL